MAYKSRPITQKAKSSPFKIDPIDPAKLKYKTTDTAKTLSGETIDIAGTANVVIPASRQRRSFSEDPEKRAEEERWIKENPEAYKKLIAETRPQEVTVTRERSVDTKEKTYPNPFKGRSTYGNLNLDPDVVKSDSIPASMITNIYKRANDIEGYNRYLEEHGYTRTKNKPTKSEKISGYTYKINK